MQFLSQLYFRKLRVSVSSCRRYSDNTGPSVKNACLGPLLLAQLDTLFPWALDNLLHKYIRLSWIVHIWNKRSLTENVQLVLTYPNPAKFIALFGAQYLYSTFKKC